MNAALLLDYVSVAVFAVTGALAASRARLDIIGFIFLSCLTAVGGGTMRDLLLRREDVFWVAEPNIILVASATAVLLYFTSHLFESRLKALMWADAAALSVAVVAGTSITLELMHPPVIVVLMGVATACLGGLMRDVVCNEVPLILRKGELYASAAFAGAVLILALDSLELSPAMTNILGGSLVFALRGGSLLFGWNLPTYKARPPRK